MSFYHLSPAWIALLSGTIALGTMPAIASPKPTREASTIAPLKSESLEQLTSVSQLSDVQPTDWAFQALQSLVERYGCIAGYPDGTYRGSRPLTRYEFAAGLNACMDRVNELIAAATADLVTKEDLEALRRLQEEFAAELATLRGRVDALEARSAKLEAQQFSTTTKLSGEAIFSLAGAYGAAPGGQDVSTVFNNRVRLNLLTSFSGRDLLITGLQSYNFGGGSSTSLLPVTGGSISGTMGYGDAVFGNASNVRLAYEPQFPTVDPRNLATVGGNNSVSLYKLVYIFPAADKITLFAGTNVEVPDAFPSILPFAGEGQGSLSRFGQLPAAHRVSGGTSGIGLAAAGGFIWSISEAIDLRGLYASVNANVPNNAGFPGTPLGAGLFNGSFVAATQLTLRPSRAFDIGLNYAYSYHQINILGTGLSSADIISINTPLAGATRPIQMHTIGATAAFKLSPTVTLAGTGTYIFSNLVNVNASTNFLSWMVGLHVKDLFAKGNSAGILFGQPLSRESVGGTAFKLENATPYHLEGYLNLRLSDNISVTPGVFVVFNPEGFSTNRTAVVPVVRTTFSF
ncbi:MAG: iron uptake porin [Leptolyngbyaceae cyanobacterium bins.59]|nr:iron uptake porin [Leptolyngbyaceae cyanobacterium bins.59]